MRRLIERETHRGFAGVTPAPNVKAALRCRARTLPRARRAFLSNYWPAVPTAGRYEV